MRNTPEHEHQHLIRIEKHIEDVAHALKRIERVINLTHKEGHKIMIDTSALIAAVAAERGDVQSLIALSNAQKAAMQDVSNQLAALIAAGGGDPAALAKVQADLDQAVTDLSADDPDVQAAIANNTPTPAPAP